MENFNDAEVSAVLFFSLLRLLFLSRTWTVLFVLYLAVETEDDCCVALPFIDACGVSYMRSACLLVS